MANGRNKVEFETISADKVNFGRNKINKGVVIMKKILIIGLAFILGGCATLTEDANTPVALSFSDGSSGKCHLTNKRGAWEVNIPSTSDIRKSDDALKYDCQTKDGRRAVGSIPSEMGGKIIASAVFLDFGITDAITDKHRKYASSYVIPIKATDK